MHHCTPAVSSSLPIKWNDAFPGASAQPAGDSAHPAGASAQTAELASALALAAPFCRSHRGCCSIPRTLNTSHTNRDCCSTGSPHRRHRRWVRIDVPSRSHISAREPGLAAQVSSACKSRRGRFPIPAILNTAPSRTNRECCSTCWPDTRQQRGARIDVLSRSHTWACTVHRGSRTNRRIRNNDGGSSHTNLHCCSTGPLNRCQRSWARIAVLSRSHT